MDTPLNAGQDSRLLQELDRAETLLNILENTWHAHCDKLLPLFVDADQEKAIKESETKAEYNPLIETPAGRQLRGIEYRIEQLTSSIAYISRNTHI